MPHADLTFRLAEIADAVNISALVNSAYRGETSRQGWTTEESLLGGQRTDPEKIKETMASKGSVILLAFDGVELVGCVHLQRKVESAYLGMLTIDPSKQAAGAGRQLLDYAESLVKNEWSTEVIEMTVITLRTELIAWYERRGYSRTGEYEAFPYGDERFGLPKRADLKFELLRKRL